MEVMNSFFSHNVIISVQFKVGVFGHSTGEG